jgi:flagellar biosynthetic protein FliR
VLRLGNRWDLVLHQSLKRDAKGEIREFDIDPRLLEEFGQEAGKAIRSHIDAGERFVLVTAPDARPYVRMIIERLFPTLAGPQPCRNRQGRRNQGAGLDLMTATLPDLVIAAFIAFCRVGGCFLVMPGMSSVRVPMQVRLFVAVAATLRSAHPHVGRDPAFRAGAARRASASDHFGNDHRRADRPRRPDLCAVAAIHRRRHRHDDRFRRHDGLGDRRIRAAGAAGLAIVLFSAAASVRDEFPPRDRQGAGRVLSAGADQRVLQSADQPDQCHRHVSQSFYVMLRLGSPFLAYSLLVNLAIGFVNKLTPQIPVYFISLPFVIFGGLVLLYWGVGGFLSLFVDSFLPVTIGR